jgi:hypothetical protein
MSDPTKARMREKHSWTTWLTPTVVITAIAMFVMAVMMVAYYLIAFFRYEWLKYWAIAATPTLLAVAGLSFLIKDK